LTAAPAARVLLTRDGAIATLTINRPAALNALDLDTLDAIVAMVAELDRDTSLRCGILTGAGDRAFAAGADIKAMAELDADAARAFSERAHRACDAIEAARVPVIAAVNGFALGGGFELALACDFIYAARGAKLGQPEVGLGVIPGIGGTQRLARRIGLARAKELIYTAAALDADEAARFGIVNEVVEPGELVSRARAVAARIAAQAPLAIAAAKRTIQQGAALPWASAMTLEQGAFAELFGSDDQKEGMRAFIAKRPPAWQGR
jgi:enoyl-CoA hydratase